MSFQKAHQYSNELGEVIIQTPEFNANSGAVNNFTFPPSFKEYRILEVGLVVTEVDSITPEAVEGMFSVLNAGGSPIANGITADGLVTLSEKGESLTSSNGDFVFSGTSAARIDADGFPFLSKGDQPTFSVTGATSGSITVVAFMRLAPNIEFKD